MNTPRKPFIRPFRRPDQDDARRLLAAGFREHFGDAYDEAEDHDLDDVAALFLDGVFLVAILDRRIVGTGGLVVLDDQTAEVRRMSTRRKYRRGGVASAVLSALLDEARVRGCRRVILGTEVAWDDAVSLYRSHGFREAARPGSSIWFELAL